jgi:betaine-aldehyde dehydrogenase
VAVGFRCWCKVFGVARTQLSPDGNAMSERTLINPATGEAVAQVPEMSPRDVDAAVTKAAAAYDDGGWGRNAPRERAVALDAIADLIDDHGDELARLDSLNTGRPLKETRADMEEAAGFFRFFAKATVWVSGETFQLQGGILGLTLREPRGVVGSITPWNYPLPASSVKVAPALAAGNTCVLKPSELTPLSALRLAELVTEAECLPPGVLNVVTGSGEVTGAAVVEHPGIAMVSFTGGTDTGRVVLGSAARTLKPVSVELGGKTPSIVFPDADLNAALEGSLMGAFSAHGQNCVAASRLLLHEDVHDEFLERFCQRAAELRLGDPFDPATQFGPLVSEQQLRKVERYVAAGTAEGARLLTGGSRPDGGLAKGFYYRPTVFAGAGPRSTISQEEIFGPVVSALRFRSVEEAISVANGTRYGLATGVWTSDLGVATRVAREVRAGMVWINDFNAFWPELPYGGYKESGFSRELGRAGLEEYTSLKQITIRST